MRRIFPLLFLLLLAFTPSTAQAADCEFRLGFATLRDLIGHEIVGECLENEHYNEIGDSNQQTTGGLMAWRKADNWTAFTDGYRTWVNGPFGVKERLNTERYFWEGDYADHTPIVEAEVCFPIEDAAEAGALVQTMIAWFDEWELVGDTLQQGSDDSSLLHDDEWRATVNAQLGSFQQRTQEVLSYEPTSLSILAYYAPNAAIVTHLYNGIASLTKSLKAEQEGSYDFDALAESIAAISRADSFLDAIPEISRCGEQQPPNTRPPTQTRPIPTAEPDPVATPTPQPTAAPTVAACPSETEQAYLDGLDATVAPLRGVTERLGNQFAKLGTKPTLILDAKWKEATIDELVALAEVSRQLMEMEAPTERSAPVQGFVASAGLAMGQAALSYAEAIDNIDADKIAEGTKFIQAAVAYINHAHDAVDELCS